MEIVFNQISYKEILFTFENNIFKTGDPISVKMAPVMKVVDKKKNIVALQLTVEYYTGEKAILKYAGIVLFMAKDWKTIINEEEVFNEFKLQLWSQTLGFFRGIICEKVKGTDIENFFLPQMPDADLMKIKVK